MEKISKHTRYCLYARKSTESDEKQALSIDSQIDEMKAVAERLGLRIVETKKESHSAKESGTRPVFLEMINELNIGKYDGIITWSPDRLSRNAGDLGSLVDLMDQKKLLRIQTYGQSFSNSPNEKFLLMILCSQAKLENDNKSINIKRGMRARCEQGLWPTRPPTGYVKMRRTDKKCITILDKERSGYIKQMFEKVGHDGWSGRKVYSWLKHDINFMTESGKHLSLGNIYQLLQNHFYYGRFEYPKNSGNWYDGSYEPLISKELFDIVQEQITRQTLVPKSQQKEFAFTKIMKCGNCGSGITADEKFKHHKNGNVHRYVYYTCTKTKNIHCDAGYMNENDLIKQLKTIIEDIDIKALPMKDKIKYEVERYKKFQNMLLENQPKIIVKNIDLKNYAKFILLEGSISEQRELIGCLKGEIFVDKKRVYLRN